MTPKSRFAVANIDPVKVETVLREAAATYILPRFRALKEHEVDTKTGPNDLVSIADIEAEEFLERALPSVCPGFIVIGEEGVSKGRKTTAILKDPDALVFVSDPVDGTNNFVHESETFCTMLACVAGGEVVGGWIYDIVKDRMLTVEKGSGTWINGTTRLGVAAGKLLNECDGYAGRKYFPAPLRAHVTDFKKQVRTLETLNCAGHEYINLSSGKTDFAIYSRIRPWDHLAGTLAVREAGGHVLKWDGTPYVPGDEFGGVVVASQADLLRTLQQGVVRKMVADYKDSRAPL